MWADVQKGCGMGLGGYADLRVPSFVHTTLHTMHTILHTILAIVCSLNLGLSGDLGVLHTMHTIL